jgi:type I restriction enzyme S subunit
LSLFRAPDETVASIAGGLQPGGARRLAKPYPTYKASGVPWREALPAHWELAPVYARYEVALGKMLDARRVTGESSGRYLRNIDVQWDAVNIDGLPEMDFPSSQRDRYLLRQGDLLVCEGGEVGRTAIWRGELAE